jgi:pimeloyl-ACP methyl ester carboxylesterase
MTLINGAYKFTEDNFISQYDRYIFSICIDFLKTTKKQDHKYKNILALIDFTNKKIKRQKDLLEIIHFPFQNIENFRTYTKLALGLSQHCDPVSRFKEISSPTLYLTGTEDNIQPFNSSVHAHTLTPKSEISILRGQDHYAIYTHPETIDLVSNFVAKH